MILSSVYFFICIGLTCVYFKWWWRPNLPATCYLKVINACRGGTRSSFIGAFMISRSIINIHCCAVTVRPTVWAAGVAEPNTESVWLLSGVHVRWLKVARLKVDLIIFTFSSGLRAIVVSHVLLEIKPTAFSLAKWIISGCIKLLSTETKGYLKAF